MTKALFYNEYGELIACEHPNPDYRYDKMFYQNISRAREKLCIVVVGNMEMFEKLLMIKKHKLAHYDVPEHARK